VSSHENNSLYLSLCMVSYSCLPFCRCPSEAFNTLAARRDAPAVRIITNMWETISDIYVCTHAKLAIHYMKQGIIIAKSGQDVIMGIELS
jgi:hypothetical protein